MKLNIIPGSTSKIISIFVSDSSATDGSGLAGLDHESGGLVARYKREGQATWSTITLVVGTLGTWVSSGFKEDAIAGGWYELSLPDAVLAYNDGVNWVTIDIRGASNMAPLPIEIQLDINTALIKGLLGVNSVLDDFDYDSNSKATLGNLYIYTTAAQVATHVSGAGGPGLVAKILGVATIGADGNTADLSRTVA